MEQAFSERHMLEWPSSLGSPELRPDYCLSLLWQGRVMAWRGVGGGGVGDAIAGARPGRVCCTQASPLEALRKSLSVPPLPPVEL